MRNYFIKFMSLVIMFKSFLTVFGFIDFEEFF